MQKLNKQELNMISGGISGTVLTAIVNGVQLIYDLGKSLGSAIRRFTTGRYC